MKTFLEEYGFVILIAIVIILLIVMATPVGNTIKSSILGLTDSFDSKTSAKIDKTHKETHTTLNGSKLTIESPSETDKYVAVLRGYQGGKKVSVASTDNKLTCTDDMTDIATFTGATRNVETSGGIAKFIIENGDKLDEGSKYYVEIMNIGTGEIFKSDVATIEHHKLAIDMSNINTTLASGDFSTKGNIVEVNGKNYKVLASSGTQAKLLAMESYTSSIFGDDNTYSDSELDNVMTSFYNNLPEELQNAIVEQNIHQSTYAKGDSGSADFSSWYKNSFTESTASGTNFYLKKASETNVGNRKVYALDIDDIISYLGSTSTPQDLNELFYNQRTSVSEYIWLRTAYSGSAGDSGRAFRYSGGSGNVSNSAHDNIHTVRPAFVLDLSLLSE